MTNFIKTFRADESGAVTVDWVVLTAAVVGLGIAVMAVVVPAVTGTGNTISTNLQAAGDLTNPTNIGNPYGTNGD